MLDIDNQIKLSDEAIERHIDSSIFLSRGAISQDVLSRLRTLVEQIIIKIYLGNEKNRGVSQGESPYEVLKKAKRDLKTKGQYKFLYVFHNRVQGAVAHNIHTEDSSERLMLEYYGDLLEIRQFAKKELRLEILSNLDRFPVYENFELKQYYEKIIQKIKQYKIRSKSKGEQYYIHKIKKVFVGEDIFYEVTFLPAMDRASKSSRLIAFTSLKIKSNYAVRLDIISETIEVFGKEMPISIILGWEVAIRMCEYSNFMSIILGKKVDLIKKEEKLINGYLTTTEFTLSDILSFPEKEYQELVGSWKQQLGSSAFIDALIICRKIIDSNSPGSNVLRYLLHCMNNVIIKQQIGTDPNNRLSELYLSNACIPFDRLPYSFSLRKHNPKLVDLFDCIPYENRDHELLARHIKVNTEVKGLLFTKCEDIKGYNKINELAYRYNNRLWHGHKPKSELIIEEGNAFIHDYREKACSIMQSLKVLSEEGMEEYSSWVRTWLNSYNIDCEEKEEILKQLFSNTQVAVVYGSAGVGKTTLISHVAHLFANKTKLFLAHTNPAINNLRGRIKVEKSTFSTISKLLHDGISYQKYDLVVIDECSTVSNDDIDRLLKGLKFDQLLLVGDPYQIESIRFGNWFSIAKSFIPQYAVFELEHPYRTKNKDLLTLWEGIRKQDRTVLEHTVKNEYSSNLDETIFEPLSENEIILCLNYDGLYGINNINRFLQQSNSSQPIKWGVSEYKIGDPILFNDIERFHPGIYNNLKGKIIDIKVYSGEGRENKIRFDIELNAKISPENVSGRDIEIIGSGERGNSMVRFYVYKHKAYEDDDLSVDTLVPFEVAYAVSIHKAQGLEYDSVKVVVTDEVGELITHNILYTAITRARENLKIYWSPETQYKILHSIQPMDNSRDAGLLKRYLNRLR